ncbi:MAG: fatty-acyl-CoA synthase [Candidatus Tectimicrobiota bacterium]|nr:MAG: fatty-acyl-CoA synthase [Candidatus Tectomicrobia bacterium]
MAVHDFTLYDMLQRNAEIHADRPAVVSEQGTLSFRQFLHRVDTLAAGLAGLGLQKGERVCVLALNHPAYLELYGACAKLGLLAYPINWRLSPEEIGRIVARAEPRLLVVDATTRPQVAEWPASRQDIAHWYTFEETPAAGFTPLAQLYRDAEAPAAARPEDPFAVISTAAVDVIPRGAVLTHANLLAANLQSMACLGLSEHDCHLLALPLFHIAALGAALAVMHAGGANVVMPRFDAAQAVRLIDTHRVTYITSFPPVLSNLLDAAQQAGSRLPSLKHVTGLEGPEAIARLHAQTSAQFWTGFGQTETSGFVTLQRYADHPGSAGKAAPLCRIKLVDDYDREVPVGTPGEILVRGPVVFQGYFRQPEVTAYTFRGGWHHTGDVGRLDEAGYLYYVRRKPEKELIKPGGENVYPAEVEAVIMELEGVSGVCVFGVPDPQWGEAIKAVVELRPGATLTAQQVIDHVGSRIARYKRPKWVSFTEALPKTAEGSVDREAVKATWGEPGH